MQVYILLKIELSIQNKRLEIKRKNGFKNRLYILWKNVKKI